MSAMELVIGKSTGLGDKESLFNLLLSTKKCDNIFVLFVHFDHINLELYYK